MRDLQRHDHAREEHRQRDDGERIDAEMRHLREYVAQAQGPAQLFDSSGEEQDDGADPLDLFEHERTDVLQQPRHHFLSSSSIINEVWITLSMT